MKTMNDVSAIKYGFPESRVLLSIKGVTMLSHHMSSSVVVVLRVSSKDDMRMRRDATVIILKSFPPHPFGIETDRQGYISNICIST